MQVIESTHGLTGVDTGCALTIGNFDGVHLGHKKVIDATKTACKKFGASGTAVLTFEPHPVAILHPEKAPGVLTPMGLKRHLLAGAGIDYLIVLRDSYDLLNLSPKDFVDEFLVEHLKPVVVVEGANFNFGYGRSGTCQTLKDLSAERDFEVEIVSPMEVHLSDRRKTICSSSLIRGFLEEGSVSFAGSLLGRPYRLIGETVRGRGVGKRLGFPTANIHITDQIVPAEGVYAGSVRVANSFTDACGAGVRRPAAISVGRAKTFVTDHPLLTEAHILDGAVGDLNGKWLALDFVKRIRPQIRFATEEELKVQIAKDCQTARTILATQPL